MRERKKVTDYFTQAGIFSVVATCFFIPFFTSLMGFFAALVVLFWLLSGKCLTLPRLLKEKPVVLVATLLFGLFILGLSYSPVGLEEGLDTVKKYRELIYFAAIVSLLHNNQTASKAAENGFVCGCLVALLISYGMTFSLIPSDRFGDATVYHITHSFFMAILAFWSAHRAIDSKQYRYLWAVFFLLATLNLMLVSPGRTGMFIFLCLMLLLLAQRLSAKQLVSWIVLFTVLIGAAYIFSTNVSTRVNQAIDEVQTYEEGRSRTSLGMRFDWYKNCIALIKEKPFIGHGTGAFPRAHDTLIAGTNVQPTDNPHNEYLFIGVQLGMVGLVVFILLFIIQWICSFKLEEKDKWMVQGVIVSMVVGCLMNSFLFDSHQGHYYAFLSALFLTDAPPKTFCLSVR